MSIIFLIDFSFLVEKSAATEEISSNAQEELLFKQHHISATQALAMSDWLLDVDARAMDAIRLAKERGFVATGDAVIVVTGWVRSPWIFHLCL